VRQPGKAQPVRPPAFAYQTDPARFPSRGHQSHKPATLHCEQVSLASLAARYLTPLYVYSAAMIRARLQAFERAFHGIPHTLCYSVKANSNLSILRLVASEGAGYDIVSGGEMERILRASRKSASKVVFSGVGKTAAEMKFALQSNILLFNVESAAELDLLASVAASVSKRGKTRARIALRVNPDVPAKTHPYISTGLHRHKFGVPIAEAKRLYTLAARSPYIDVAGVSVHIGSQITDVSSFHDALVRVAELVHDLRKQGHDVRYVDAGGGLGISYATSPRDRPEDFRHRINGYAKAIRSALRGLGVHLLLEPGRSIVGPAGALVTRVLYRKKNGRKRFLIVDAAMNDLLRPSLYGAYHEIVPVRQIGGEMETTDVVGPICETGDFFARDRRLPETKAGDLVAILDVGAYGLTLSSNYNTRSRAAEILVEGRKSKLIRKRETASDQMSLER
jgi:diaminopimelate decarboxylase